MKKQVTKVEILWSESREIEDGKTFASIAEANSYLYRAAYFAPKCGAYDKTKYTVTWEDGGEYTGRIDLQHTDYDKDSYKIDKAIESYLKFYSGEHCPAWMTEEKYQEALTFSTDEGKKECLEFLATYDFN
jgi:hypothetical protein